MPKYIELDSVLTYLKNRKKQRIWDGDSEEYVKNAEMDNMKIHFDSLPTIDPIATIDEMQESIKFHKPEGIEYMQSTLKELKSRLSLNK